MYDATKNSALIRNGRPSRRALTPPRNSEQRSDGEGRERYSPIPVFQIALSDGSGVHRNRYDERKAQHRDHASDKPGYTRVGPLAKGSLVPVDKPASTEQGIPNCNRERKTGSKATAILQII